MYNIWNCSFECLEKFDYDKCYFHGKAYSIGEEQPDEYPLALCDSDCVCSENDNSPASFECPEDDEGGGCYDRYNNTCIFQYDSLQNCCPDVEMCGKYNSIKNFSNLAKGSV